MIAAAKKSKKILMVGQNQRLMSPHVKAKEILSSGRLGKVLTFETTFKHPGPDGWSIDSRAGPGSLRNPKRLWACAATWVCIKPT